MSQLHLPTRRPLGICALLLATCWLACGGSSTLVEGEGGSAGGTGGTGGAGGTGGETGGTGGGVGGSGGTSPSTCQSIAGTYELGGEGFAGEPPWIWIQESTDFGCSAIVSSKRYPGRRYEVAISADKAVLTPMDEAARGGYDGSTQHHLTVWNEIRLDLAQGKPNGTASASTIYDWSEEDIWGEDEVALDDLTVAPATPGTVEMEEAVLPWREALVLASRPTSGISAHLLGPSAAWVGSDEVEAGAEGVIEARLRYAGTWDDVRGQVVSFSASDNLVDISGAALSASTLALSVVDVGPAIPSHEMFDATSVATWGSVEPFEEGDCAAAGCAVIRGYCGSYAGIAGQLLTEGASEAVLFMRLEVYDTYVNTPALSAVEVIAEDGTRLTPKSGGTWDSEQAEQTWVYDVSGLDKVGFAIEASSYCHGWGGPIIVDSISAQ